MNLPPQKKTKGEIAFTADMIRQMSVTEIKTLMAADSLDSSFVTICRQDSRVSVQKLIEAYDRKVLKLQAEFSRIQNMYSFESEFYDQGLFQVAGVDEVGRGPIAGPVTVAAVILPPRAFLPGLNDSKKIPEHKREILYDQIMSMAVAVSCISYGPERIDELNIYEATRQAMYEAVQTLSLSPDAVMVDAMKLPDLSMPVRSIIKGDAKSANIAAASIIAKVTRDRYMKEMDAIYPEYGFGDHKGYYTQAHKYAVEQYGVTPIHRKSFEPIKSIVNGRFDESLKHW